MKKPPASHDATSSRTETACLDIVHSLSLQLFDLENAHGKAGIMATVATLRRKALQNPASLADTAEMLRKSHTWFQLWVEDLDATADKLAVIAEQSTSTTH